MVYVPTGEFTMGREDGREDSYYDNEKPTHTVYLDAFWIDQTEVTNAMYTLCVQDGECSSRKVVPSYTRIEYYGNPQYDNYPVVFVSWNDALSFCNWAGRRLPTEAEWEKAARGIDERKHPWGDEPPEHPNSTFVNLGAEIYDTMEVGSFPKGVSPYGALDMAGNVWEWVNDWYDPLYYQYSSDLNPTGPETGIGHVIRGYYWNFGAESPTTIRVGGEWSVPSYKSETIGFRCAMDAE